MRYLIASIVFLGLALSMVWAFAYLNHVFDGAWQALPLGVTCGVFFVICFVFFIIYLVAWFEHSLRK